MSKNNTNSRQLKQLKEVAGLFTCVFDYKVTETKTNLNWKGPKIPPEEWHKVLAFFEWTYATTQSESQVRLYVNQRLNTWKAWAYPQKAKMGMASDELGEHPDYAKQRMQFNPDDGWLYFGTVHHHCSGGAFQSPHDEHNEKNQDGLHITVGSLKSERYTVHDRFYLCGNLIAHDLSWFWDIGDVAKDVPQWAMKLMPADIEDRLARGMMTEKAPENTQFPKEWEANMVYEKPKPIESLPTHYQGGLGYQGTASNYKFQRVAQNLHFDLAEARRQFRVLCQEFQADEVDGLAELQYLADNQFVDELITLMYRNDVTLERFTAYINEDLVGEKPETMQQSVEDALNAGKLPQ